MTLKKETFWEVTKRSAMAATRDFYEPIAALGKTSYAIHPATRVTQAVPGQSSNQIKVTPTAEAAPSTAINPVGVVEVKTSQADQRGADLKQNNKYRISDFHVLVVDEDENIRSVCCKIAESMGYTASGVGHIADVQAILKHRTVDLVLLDLKGSNEPVGLGLIEQIKLLYPYTEVVVMTALATVSFAIQAMRVGAGDYLTKPFVMEELTKILDRSGQRAQFDFESRLLRERLRNSNGMGDLIGRSPGMEKLFRLLSKVANSTHPVLIFGESGSGKESAARSIHFNGPHANKPFVAVDCGSLIESELFGYVKGAFAGATRAKEGLLASAEGGTLFLDEIDELRLDMQATLLHVLQEKEIHPVGAAFAVPLSVRVLSATKRNLQSMVEQGLFRKDLFFRLNVVNLRIPPLRERREDIALLTEHFLKRIQRQNGVAFSFKEEAMRAMIDYDWPGNVRELENAVERACALSSGPLLHLGDLPPQVQDFRLHSQSAANRQNESDADRGTHAAESSIITIAEMEKQAILETIRQLNGDKLMAAKLLGIGKTNLYRKLKEYGIESAGEVSH